MILSFKQVTICRVSACKGYRMNCDPDLLRSLLPPATSVWQLAAANYQPEGNDTASRKAREAAKRVLAGAGLVHSLQDEAGVEEVVHPGAQRPEKLRGLERRQPVPDFGRGRWKQPRFHLPLGLREVIAGLVSDLAPRPVPDPTPPR